MDRQAQLKAAYTATRYDIELSEGEFCSLQPSRKNKPLDDWMRTQALQQLYVISADNPASRILTAEQNQQALGELQQELDKRKWPHWPAHNRAIKADWPLEKSLAVGAPTAQAALQLAEQFGQYALLAHRRGEASELLYTELFENIDGSD